MILDKEEDDEVVLILGRPFLTTRKAMIDVEQGKLVSRFPRKLLKWSGPFVIKKKKKVSLHGAI